MKLLVFGGHGMLGRAVGEAARDAGHESIAVGRGTGGGDVSDREQVARTLDGVEPDAVVNAAGVIPPTVGKTAAADPDVAMVMTNALGPLVLADACRERGVRFVHVSTDCVFAGTRPRFQGVYRPSAKPDAVDLYGRSKAVGELVFGSSRHRDSVLVERDHSLFAVVRTSFIGFDHGLLRWFVEQAAAGRPAEGWRDALWSGSTVWEVARQLVRIAEALVDKPDVGGIVHLATAAPQAKSDVLRLVRNILELSVPIDVVGGKGLDRSLGSTWPLGDLWDPAVADELRRRWGEWKENH